MELGKLGVWTSYRQIGEENAGAAARLAEECGYGTFWLGGSPRLSQVRPLLEATERIAVGTSIVNIWAYEPTQLAAEYAELAPEFGERLMVGVGVGHPEATSDYTRPLSAMREFLDGIDAAPTPIPPERRALAALGPKMLDLAGERSTGTLPYFVPLEHTAAARQRLGPEPLVATEVACVVDADRARARAAARSYAKLYLGLSNYTANLRRFGFDDADIEGEGSDRLIDAVIPHGGPAEVAAVLRAHLEAGADHVAVQPVGGEGIPAEAWRTLAEQLA